MPGKFIHLDLNHRNHFGRDFILALVMPPGKAIFGELKDRAAWLALLLILSAWLPSACTRFSQPVIQPDLAAEQIVDGLRRTNADLVRFKIVGNMTLSGPNRPAQAFRAAMAGELSDRIRIDMFAPFGGSTGTVSSDGEYLYLVMHSSREYYKLRFGSGSLKRIIRINITVGDLLELLAGRIPMNTEFSARLMPTDQLTSNQGAEKAGRSALVLVDRRGTTRQRITLNDRMQPVRSVWLDSSQDPTHTVVITGHQIVDGFVLPKQIELVAMSGERVSVILDRYEANAGLDGNLFTPAAPSS